MQAELSDLSTIIRDSEIAAPIPPASPVKMLPIASLQTLHALRLRPGTNSLRDHNLSLPARPGTKRAIKKESPAGEPAGL